MKRIFAATLAMVIASAVTVWGLNFGWQVGGSGANKFYLNGVGKGAYSTLENYSATTAKFHYVTYSGSMWGASKNNGAASPQIPFPGSAYWGKLTGADSKVPGPPGTQGNAGANGPSSDPYIAYASDSSGTG